MQDKRASSGLSLWPLNNSLKMLRLSGAPAAHLPTLSDHSGGQRSWHASPVSGTKLSGARVELSRVLRALSVTRGLDSVAAPLVVSGVVAPSPGARLNPSPELLLGGVGLCDGPKVVMPPVTVVGGLTEVTGAPGGELQEVSMAGGPWLVAAGTLAGLRTAGEMVRAGDPAVLRGREEVEGAVVRAVAGLVGGEDVCGKRPGEVTNSSWPSLVSVVAGVVARGDAVSSRPWASVWVTGAKLVSSSGWGSCELAVASGAGGKAVEARTRVLVSAVPVVSGFPGAGVVVGKDAPTFV